MISWNKVRSSNLNLRAKMFRWYHSYKPKFLESPLVGKNHRFPDWPVTKCRQQCKNKAAFMLRNDINNSIFTALIYNHSSMIVSVRKGCISASFALSLVLGSILRHLLRKSIKLLLLDLILAFKLVILGVKTLQKPVFLFFLFPSISSPTSSQISQNKISSLVKYLFTSLPFSIIQEGHGPRSPWILANIPTTLSL